MKRYVKLNNPFMAAMKEPSAEDMSGFIYIVGPIPESEDENIDALTTAKAKLEEMGYHAVLPHEVIDPDASWINAVTTSLIVIEKSDGVVYLDGSLDSPEGCIQLTAAGYIGKPCMHINDWLEEDNDI